MGGDQRSQHIEAHSDLILSLCEATPDITLQELRAALTGKASRSAMAAVALLRPARDPVKKDGACGRTEPPGRLDTARGLVRRPARPRPRPTRVHRRDLGVQHHGSHARPGTAVPHGHWKTTTFVAGLRQDGIAAPFVLDGPINRQVFETYVARVLVPELRLGNVVIMDNLSSHKGRGVRELIEAAGATSRPTRRTSTDRERLRSRRSSARQPSEPSARSGTGSATSSTPSHPPSAPTTSRPQVAIQTERIPL
jgi:hypothetical protein